MKKQIPIIDHNDHNNYGILRVIMAISFNKKQFVKFV